MTIKKELVKKRKNKVLSKYINFKALIAIKNIGRNPKRCHVMILSFVVSATLFITFTTLVQDVIMLKGTVPEYHNIDLEISTNFIEDKNKEAFSNIIKNCIEHMPQGGSVKVSLESNFAFNKVTITDTGEGIDQSDRANIFERFYKSKVSNKKDSVGIGLSIAKAIIEDHNGYIDVKSEKGIGTTFVITFIK